jgi:hypothetical protein
MGVGDYTMSFRNENKFPQQAGVIKLVSLIAMVCR